MSQLKFFCKWLAYKTRTTIIDCQLRVIIITQVEKVANGAIKIN